MRDVDDLPDRQIAVARRRGSEKIGFIGQFDMQRMRVDFGIDGDRRDAQSFRRSHDSAGDLAAVRDEELAHHLNRPRSSVALAFQERRERPSCASALDRLAARRCAASRKSSASTPWPWHSAKKLFDVRLRAGRAAQQVRDDRRMRQIDLQPWRHAMDETQFLRLGGGKSLRGQSISAQLPQRLWPG